MSTRRLYVRFCYLKFFNVKSLVDLRVSTSVDANFYSILHEKTYFFFYFTYLFLQNTHISLSILHIYSIKYSFFYNFLLFPPSLPSLLQTHSPSLPTITPHLANIITTQPASSRKTNPLNSKPIQSQTH